MRVSLPTEAEVHLAAAAWAAARRSYDEMSSRQGPREVLDRLTAAETEALLAYQADHLLALLDRGTSPEHVAARGREIGRALAMVGADIEWYAQAVSTQAQEVLDCFEGEPDPQDREPDRGALGRRLANELGSVLAGYRELDASLHRAMLRINDAVASAGTVPDLVQGVLDACVAVDGITAGFFGRPDDREVFQFEMGVGSGAEEFMGEIARREPLTITVLQDETSGQGPSGRSWRTGTVERSDSYLTDPCTAPWHELGARLGWRSSVSVPVSDVRGEPHALLSLYSSLPGYFATPERLAALDQLRRLLERALSTLESRTNVASAVRTYTARSSYLARLRGGDVEMAYQPIVDLRTGRLWKVEALARLRADRRLLLPAEFLPALGDEDLLELFRQGLDQSLATLRSWDVDGVHVDVALNLPGISRGHDRYVAIVEQALVRHRVLPSRLTLEMLETGHPADRSRRPGSVLEHLKALGVRLAQDDLGSGHSSLLRLRHFAFDDVKLDQSLVRGHEFDPRGALNFIHPLTRLAHSMGLTVIVEGLENRGLVEAALVLGADAGQGYGISRPLTSEAIPAWSRGFRLRLEPERPSTHLGALAGHVAWEQRTGAVTLGDPGVPDPEGEGCPLGGYLERIVDPGGHLAEAHAAVHRSVSLGLGSDEHMRWWRILTKMLADSPEHPL